MRKYVETGKFFVSRDWIFYTCKGRGRERMTRLMRILLPIVLVYLSFEAGFGSWKDIWDGIWTSYEYDKWCKGIDQAYGPSFKIIREKGHIKDIIYVPLGKSISRIPEPNRHNLVKKEAPHFLRIAKKEAFPYIERIIDALGEYAGYFLFWEAYYCSNQDVKKAINLIGETARRYPTSSAGKIAKSIIDKGKGEKEIIMLIQEEFGKLGNPVETYERREDEPENSVMNNLKKAIGSLREYKGWREVFRSDKYKEMSEEKAKESLAREGIEDVITLLDGYICFFLDELGKRSFMAPDQDLNLCNHYLTLIITRYPDSQQARFAKSFLNQLNKSIRGGK
jgi:hypothetical protein